VLRTWLALALLSCSGARGQAPSYSAAGIVNAVGYTAGPFAPNSVVSIFGSNLAWDPGLFTNTSASILPTQLDSVSVYVDYQPAPLLMVSQGQINFIIPSTEIPGNAIVVVERQGMTGPAITLNLASSAPTLFPSTGGYVLAEDWNNGSALITTDAPAHAGDTIVLFVTGLGAVQVAQGVFDIPSLATSITNLAGLQVILNGTAVDPMYIKYAGLTPGCAGLYQINLLLPLNTVNDPTIQVSLGGQSSQAGLKLAVR
jgi:uncharacterized protein (TIGR03437 family)